MLESIFDSIERKRKKCLKFAQSSRCSDVLRPYYEAASQMPAKDAALKTCQIVSIDFETTGLDPKTDYVLSVGGVGIIEGHIDFGTSFHSYVNNSKFIKKDSAQVNHITPEILLSGIEPDKAMKDLMEKLCGKVVLMHCKVIETGFIRHHFGLSDSDPLPFIELDTMAIERSLNRANPNIDVRLFEIRKRRHLPSYDAHNALVDSLSTAEVLLAQVKEIFGRKTPTLGTLLRYS